MCEVLAWPVVEKAGFGVRHVEWWRFLSVMSQLSCIHSKWLVRFVTFREMIFAWKLVDLMNEFSDLLWILKNVANNNMFEETKKINFNISLKMENNNFELNPKIQIDFVAYELIQSTFFSYQPKRQSQKWFIELSLFPSFHQPPHKRLIPQNPFNIFVYINTRTVDSSSAVSSSSPPPMFLFILRSPIRKGKTIEPLNKQTAALLIELLLVYPPRGKGSITPFVRETIKNTEKEPSGS